MSTGKNIKSFRLKKGLTRAELSQLSDLPVDTLCDWENDRVLIRDWNALSRIAWNLDVKLLDFMAPLKADLIYIPTEGNFRLVRQDEHA